jgi:hypothetical protein
MNNMSPYEMNMRQQQWRMTNVMNPNHRNRPPQYDGHQSHFSSHNQLYSPRNEQVRQMELVQRNCPLVYQLMQEQQSLIREQQVTREKAEKTINSLKKEIFSFNENRTDKVPPVIMVEQHGGSSSCKDDDVTTGSSIPLKKRMILHDVNVHTDEDTLDSLPLKKRCKRYSSKHDVHTVLATLKAATSPAFASSSSKRAKMTFGV